LIGRLQLSTEKSKEEENEGIVQLRILRTQVPKLLYFYSVFLYNLLIYLGGNRENIENAEED